MKYYRQPEIIFEDELLPETLIEVDSSNSHIRSLIIFADLIIGSTFPHFKNPITEEIELTLPEGEFLIGESNETDEEIPMEIIELENSVEEISSYEFEIEWNRYLRKWESYWIEIKSNYEIGQFLKGVVEVFYPVGVIVKVGENIFGIISIKEYKTIQSKMGNNWSSGKKVNVKISGFDNVNMWIELKYVKE